MNLDSVHWMSIWEISLSDVKFRYLLSEHLFKVGLDQDYDLR